MLRERKSKIVYDIGLLNEILNDYQNLSSEYQITPHYAVKANNNFVIVNTINKGLNGHFDCVSGEEINYILNTVNKDATVVYSGSGKRKEDIVFALENNIFAIHIESLEEFYYVFHKKSELNSKTKIILRINPNLLYGGHEKISTGGNQHKFGIDLETAKMLLKKHWHSIDGYHFHVGSQIEDMNEFENMYSGIRNIVNKLGHKQYLNLGGGLGINYKSNDIKDNPSPKEWFNIIRKHFPIEKFPLIRIEPGRNIVGNIGEIHAEISWIKNLGNGKRCIVLDVGMSDILRPALYSVNHLITGKCKDYSELKSYYVTGPSCESSDVFGNYFLSENLKENDFLIIHQAGAYVESMKLNYNMRNELKIDYKF